MNTRLLLLVLATLSATFLPGCATTDPITRSNEANASASQIARDSRTALWSLYSQNRGAKVLGLNAKAVLVFPSVTRAGFMVGGQGGNGALFGSDGRIAGFFQTTGASWGLQAGIQTFGYALFLMDDNAIRNLNRSGGWEIGSSPSLVIVNRGMASSTTNNTINSGTYVFFFNQRGLMAGMGLHGTKITRIQPRW